MEVGQHWGYRAREQDPLVEVELQTVGVKKPARVKVAFVDDSSEGFSQWVPPSRLKVLWCDRVPFLRDIAAWDEMVAISEGDDVTRDVVEMIIWSAVPTSVATLHHRRDRRGLLLVKDVAELSHLAGIDATEIHGERLKIVDDRGTHLTWPAAVRIAKLLAQRFAPAIIASVEDNEETWRRERLYGSLGKAARSGLEDQIDRAQAFEQQFGAVIRKWCGVEAVTAHEEHQRLSLELEWVTSMLQHAIGALADAGETKRARGLSRLLLPKQSEKEWKEKMASSRAARELTFARVRSATWRREVAADAMGRPSNRGDGRSADGAGETERSPS